MQSIRLNDVKHFIPSSWKEVTTGEYIRILKEWDPHIEDFADKDWLKLLNIFTGTKFGSIAEDWELQYTLSNALSWVTYEPFKFAKELPKVLRFGKRDIDIPRHPNGLSIGQNIHLRRDYIDKAERLEYCIPIAAAIFLQPIIDEKKFSMERAKELAKEIEEMPIYLIYPIGFFLLRRALHPGKNFGMQWHRTKSNLSTSLERMWRRWLRLTG